MTLSPIRRRQCAVGAIALATTLMSVQPAFASANVEGLLQNVVDMLTGNTARLLAILAVVIVGILWWRLVCRAARSLTNSLSQHRFCCLFCAVQQLLGGTVVLELHMVTML